MEWISVNNELPSQDGWYLVYCQSGSVVRVYNTYHECWDDEDGDDVYCDAVHGDVTHWMPLPPPPTSHNKKLSEMKQD